MNLCRFYCYIFFDNTFYEILFMQRQKQKMIQKNNLGFTLTELLVVIAIIGILATVVLASLGKARTRARTARTIAELRNLSQTFEIYHLDNNDYPGDVSPDVLPVGMSNYLPNGQWPESVYPGAVYDWEYWDPGTATEAVQLSVRFCGAAGNIADCNFPDEEWATGFTSNQNAAFYCISGQCRPWETDLVGTVAGYCFNC